MAINPPVPNPNRVKFSDRMIGLNVAGALTLFLGFLVWATLRGQGGAMRDPDLDGEDADEFDDPGDIDVDGLE
jgi:hypothetical protein